MAANVGAGNPAVDERNGSSAQALNGQLQSAASGASVMTAGKQDPAYAGDRGGACRGTAVGR